MISLKDQESLFLGLARKLKKPITVFAIGGTAMMLHGVKEATKDIDIVFTSEKDREAFLKAATLLEYTVIDPATVYGKRDNQPLMLERATDRLDLFLRDIITVTFSPSMEARAHATFVFADTLIVKAADLHDIVIMKCATQRMKDRDDIKSIVEAMGSRFNWSIIIEEARVQRGLGRSRAVFELLGTLQELQKDFHVNVPKKVFEDIWSLGFER